MTDHHPLLDSLPGLLADLVAEHDVPGAQVAVLTPTGVVDAAAGVTNLRTQVPVTTETVFQIGSITKVLTATLVLQLVEEGLLSLDSTLAEVLPGFDVAVAGSAERITVGQLLDHSNGIDGDLFLDTGRGEDAVARYVDAMRGLTLVHPVGEAFSYSNSAYTLAGHLVATVRGAVWEDVVAERLLAPLGMTSAGTLPEHALRHDAAVGHVREADGTQRPASVWAPDRAAGPAGLVHTTMRDLLAFAQLHLGGGPALLSPASIALMQQPRTPTRDGRAVGLGWFLDDWQQPVLLHDGGTIGQLAFLRVLPRSGCAIALGTNGPTGGAVFEGLVRGLLPALGEPVLPTRPVPTPGPVPDSAADWVGTYANAGVRYDVRLDDGRLLAATTSLMPGAITQGALVPDAELLHVDGDTYATQIGPDGPFALADFLRFSDGSRGLAVGSRIAPRVG